MNYYWMTGKAVGPHHISNLLRQSWEPTNSTHIWCWEPESNPRNIDGKQEVSPMWHYWAITAPSLRHFCSTTAPTMLTMVIRVITDRSQNVWFLRGAGRTLLNFRKTLPLSEEPGVKSYENRKDVLYHNQINNNPSPPIWIIIVDFTLSNARLK